LIPEAAGGRRQSGWGTGQRGSEMRRWENSIKGPLCVLIAALLLPGGFLLLAWALYRKFLSQPVERKS